MPYVLMVLLLVLGTFFYRLAEFERRSGLVWGAASVAVAFLTFWILRWGYIGLFCSQVLLFFAMFVGNLIQGRRFQ